MTDLPETAAKKVRRASAFAFGLGVLKVSVALAFLVFVDPADVPEMVEFEILGALVAGVVLLALAACVHWRIGNLSVILFALMVVGLISLIGALAARRPSKIGIDFLLLGMFVLAWKSLPSEKEAQQTETPAMKKETGQVNSLNQGEKRLMSREAVRPDDSESQPETKSHWLLRGVKQVGIGIASVVGVLLLVGGGTYVVRMEEVERLKKPKTFYTSTPHFEITLRVSYRSEGVLQGLFDDRGDVYYRLQLEEGKKPYDFQYVPSEDQLTIRFLDDDGFLIEEWEFQLSTMTGIVGAEGKNIGLSKLGDRYGVTASEYREVDKINAIWSLSRGR